MKKNIFRPVEFWKASIMPLPDHAFFELLRTVFGKIKTPFNKQNLVSDLEKFLTNNDIRKKIAAYIDKNDASIIAAVAVLNEPTAAELDAFFEGDMDNTELRDMVINLEERFILFRFLDKDRNESRLALNPILEPVLSQYTDDVSFLLASFHNKTPDKAGKQIPFFDDRILAALLSFASQNETFFIKEGKIRQKILNMSETVFPALQLEPVMGGLCVLGLFFANGDTLLPDFNRFAAFGKLSRLERTVYCAAGILCYYDSPDGGTSPWLSRAKLRKFASFIHNFYTLLDSEQQYPLVTLRRLLFILGQNNNETNYNMLIKAMEQTGLLVSDSNKLWRKSWPDSEGATTKENAGIGAAVIAMDSPFTLLMYPEIAYNDAIELASISNVSETGLNVRFEITKDATVSAFNRGISAARIIDLLQRLSGNRIDENTAFTLLDWEKRHKEISLCKGLVLTLSPERCYLAETKPLSKYITAKLAQGIYLIPENMEEKVYTALKKAGITIFAKPGGINHENDDDSKTDIADSYFYFPHLNAEPSHTEKKMQLKHEKKDHSAASDSAASALIEGFHSVISKMHLGGEQREELTARINRRLVLCEAQLKDAVVRYEKLEAHGLDYNGKTMIAKQAITRQTPVEASWPGRKKQESVIGIPKALEKKGDESVLVIETADGNTTHLPLGKISLLRRIKKSIFENNN